MLNQIAGDERQDSMMLRQPDKLTPVERGEIPVRDALDSRRSQLRGGQRAQQAEFVFTFLCEARLGVRRQEFAVKIRRERGLSSQP